MINRRYYWKGTWLASLKSIVEFNRGRAQKNAFSVFILVQYIDLAKPKRGARIFFPRVSRAQRLAQARTRTRVVRLGAQCTDHWTTEQSRGVGVPAVQSTTHVKSSTLYGRTSKFFWLDGLLLFCIIMGLRSASSAINYIAKMIGKKIKLINA